MKIVYLFPICLSLASAFQTPNDALCRSARVQVSMAVDDMNANAVVLNSRKDFFVSLAAASLGGTTAALLWSTEPAEARGRATLEKSIERYAPRVRAGATFYANDLRQLVQKNDWAGIKSALQEPPERTKGDLNKSDAGVAERARRAGGFSDARVLVAADLLAAAFSDNSLASKTKRMQAAVAELRDVVQEMQKTARTALGEESTGGFFGLGAKKPSEAELSKKMRELYVAGGNAWNKYVKEANDELALQFDRFEYIK